MKKSNKKPQEASRRRMKAAKAGSRNKKLTSADRKLDDAEEQYIKGILERGEAAKAVEGKLPSGVTHEIIEEKENELPVIRRRRFSTF